MKRIMLVTTLLLVPISTVHANNLPVPPEKSTEELYHDLFISLLSDDIQKHVNEYYSILLKDDPLVYPYEVYIKQAKRTQGYRSFRFTVVMEVTPVIGAHNSVGKDELTYDIQPGHAKLIKYKHLETYEIPPHLKGVQL